jgi:hypothetical protein
VATVPGNGLAFRPENWKFDPDKPGLHYEHFFNHYIELEKQYDKTNIVNRFLVTKDAHGAAKFHSRQYPSPSPMNDKDAAIAYVAMTKCESLADDSQKPAVNNVSMKPVPVDQIAEAEADGWSLWDAPMNPNYRTENGTDPRTVDCPQDVCSTDKPYQDTDFWFQRQLGLLRKSQGLSPELPEEEKKQGILFGASQSQPESSISFSKKFLTPVEFSTNPISATSGGHLPKYDRPPNVGPNWGDYGLFHEWQAHGREVTKEMVKLEKSCYDPFKELVFESDTNPGETIVIPNDLNREAYESSIVPKSLYERLNPKSNGRDNQDDEDE